MSHRKTEAKYSMYLREAVQNDSLVLSSELLDDYSSFFVDMNLISKFHKKTNQLICGRRGTGKTHLLGTMNELINRGRNHSISVYVSLGEIFIPPPAKKLKEYDNFNSSQHAIEIFNSFQFLLIDRFSLLIDKLYLKNTNIPERIRNTVQDALRKLMYTVNDGVLIKRISSLEEYSENVYGSAEKKGWALNLDVAGAISQSKLGVQYQKGKDLAHDKKNYTKEVFDAHSLPNITLIRALIKQILDVLHIKSFYILIDEWMQIDKTARLDVQPFLAELIKRCLFNERSFVIKIATIWHETDLYDREDIKTSRGLQLGEDIEIGNDLDSYFIEEWQSLDTFFKEMLFKRLTAKPSDHLNLSCLFDFKKNDQISDDFILELFDSIENYRELILASHGIPREFIKMFQKCASAINYDFEKKAIVKRTIRKIAKDIYLTEKRKRIDKSSIAFRLFESINEYMATKEVRFFFVESLLAKKSLSLRKLVDEKLLHPIPSALIQRTFRDKYKCYFIDYGNYIDWYDSTKKTTNLPVPQFVTPPSITDIGEYVIDIADFDEGNRQCKSCKISFSSLERSYAIRKLCPNCFQEAD